MGKGISEVLTFAIGVAISPVPIIAVILMLFSRRARVNGPVFLLGWVLALAVVSGVAYAIADQSNPSTSRSAADAISWGKIVLGVLFLLLALRQWRNRPAADTEPEMRKWMAGIDKLSPGKALGLGLLLALPGVAVSHGGRAARGTSVRLIEAHARVPELTIARQGGEPTLMGLEFFRRSVELAERYLRPGPERRVHDPNGTAPGSTRSGRRSSRSTSSWSEFSIDGPRDVHEHLPRAHGRQGLLR